MNLECTIAGIIGGSIMYFILHGACILKKWLKKRKKNIDDKLGRE